MENGSLDTSKTNAPAKYAIIQGHRIVGEGCEHGTIEAFEATEQNLFADDVLKKCERPFGR